VGWAVNALEVAKSLGCSKFINVGTMEEPFAQAYLGLDYRVDTQYNRHVLYSLAKIAAKRALMAKSRELGIRFFHVLHSHVMGPRDTKDSFLQTVVIKLLRRENIVMSSGEQLFDVIPVQDCVNGFFLIGEKGNPDEQYWVGSGFPRKLRDYVEEIVQLLRPGHQPTYGDLPYNDVVLSADEFSIASLKRDTGFEPSVSFRECVLDLSEHLR
jgi:nucleoside-diphosphate-sugar epimerase